MYPAPFWPQQNWTCYQNSRLHRKLAGLRNPIIQTIGCYKLSGTVAFALQAGIGRIRGVAGINQVAGGKIQRVSATRKVNGLDNGRLYTGGLLRILPLSIYTLPPHSL